MYRKCFLTNEALITAPTFHKGKGKGKVLPIIDHEGPEQMYSSTLPSTSALDEGEWSSRPGRFNPRKYGIPIVQEAGSAPGPAWTGAENLAPPPTGTRSPDRPARSESLYRLSYRVHTNPNWYQY